MNKVLKSIILVVSGAIILLVLYIFYFNTHKVEISKKSKLASLLNIEDKTLRLDLQTKYSGCKMSGSLPDHDCTPGTVFPEATKEKVCVQGYSKSVRNVPVSLRKKIFAEYGIGYSQPHGSYEVDHLIPLALGGSNETANLFPEAAEPYPGFKEKDIVENYLHEEVCFGRASLSAAQEIIANNWVSVYYNLSENQIKELKSKYKSWAQ